MSKMLSIITYSDCWLNLADVRFLFSTAIKIPAMFQENIGIKIFIENTTAFRNNWIILYFNMNHMNVSVPIMFDLWLM